MFAFNRHVKSCQGVKVSRPRVAWNKGLTGETDERVRAYGLTLSKSFALNPIVRGPLSQETKDRVSKSMKLAHAEGRAWNIGKSRWNNEHSWPERFFREVIHNEFADKNFVQEFPFDRYSLDFAWPEKKKVIEIDGDQHQRFEEYRVRDAAKDAALKKAGWQILRIVWKDFYHDTKKWIAIANNFVGG